MTQKTFPLSAPKEVKLDELWCERHGKSNKFRTQAAVAYITSRLVNKALGALSGPMTRTEVIDYINEISPVCCHLGDETTFSVCMVAGMQLRGVHYLSPLMMEIIAQRRK